MLRLLFFSVNTNENFGSKEGYDINWIQLHNVLIVVAV